MGICLRMWHWPRENRRRRILLTAEPPVYSLGMGRRWSSGGKTGREWALGIRLPELGKTGRLDCRWGKFPDVGDTARSTAGYPSGSSPMDEGSILLPLLVILEVNNGISGPREPSGVNGSPSSALESMEGTDSQLGNWRTSGRDAVTLYSKTRAKSGFIPSL